eukprot:7480210-Lingulodinium_polyedra.AAC.1
MCTYSPRTRATYDNVFLCEGAATHWMPPSLSASACPWFCPSGPVPAADAGGPAAAVAAAGCCCWCCCCKLPAR